MCLEKIDGKFRVFVEIRTAHYLSWELQTVLWRTGRFKAFEDGSSLGSDDLRVATEAKTLNFFTK